MLLSNRSMLARCLSDHHLALIKFSNRPAVLSSFYACQAANCSPSVWTRFSPCSSCAWPLMPPRAASLSSDNQTHFLLIKSHTQCLPCHCSELVVLSMIATCARRAARQSASCLARTFAADPAALQTSRVRRSAACGCVRGGGGGRAVAQCPNRLHHRRKHRLACFE
jgi:hypothetical protein